MTVAALYVQERSVYRSLPDVECWPASRDARRYNGPHPVVAHPPCRAWGRYKSRSKHPPNEPELALLAVQQVSAYGGILEHPWSSSLWRIADLSAGVLIRVDQGWWGHQAPKATGLFMVGIQPGDFDLPPPRLALGRVENLCRQKRERTPPSFAAWLVSLASTAIGRKA